MNVTDALISLQTCNDNAVRKALEATIAHAQETQPHDFLRDVLAVINTTTLPPSTRFFSATSLCAFVENHWRVWNATDADKSLIQDQMIYMVTETNLSFSPPLLRKAIQAAAMMIKFNLPKKGPRQGLPDALSRALHSILMSINSAGERQMQGLLTLHLLIKELAAKRIGKIFDQTCAHILPSLSQWLTAGLNPASVVSDALIVVMKCASRVVGYGCFDVPLMHLLLQHAAQLMAIPQDGIHPLQRRVVAYTVKTFERAFSTFPTKLESLGAAFFVGTDTALLPFFFHILNTGISSPDHAADQGKLVCRAARSWAHLLSLEDSDAFIASVMSSCLGDPVAVSVLMGTLTLNYFPDRLDDLSNEWKTDPEKYVSDLDITEDDDSAQSCAEHLFLALTSSTANAATTVSQTWAVLSPMLTSSSAAELTAALHAIGLGYNTLSGDDDMYVAFLKTSLLPVVIQHASRAQDDDSALILRRVVWVIGMWCEHVTLSTDRRLVHTAFAELLQPTTQPVLLLTTIRSVEHFVSDNLFTLEEFPAGYADHLFACLKFVFPLLHTASMVKEVAALLGALVEKGILSASGDVIVATLRPAIDALIGRAELCHGEDDDSVDPSCMSTLGILLDTLSSGVKICPSAESQWSVVPVVMYCTDPTHVAASWAADHAWDLMLTIIRFTRDTCVASVTSLMDQSLRNGLCHTSRDFQELPVVVECITAMIVAAPSLLSAELLHSILHLCAEQLPRTSDAVFAAYCGLTDVLMLIGREATAVQLFPSISALVVVGQMEDDPRGPLIALLVSRCILLIGNDVASTIPLALVEELVALTDVCPSRAMCCVIVSALQKLCEQHLITSPEAKALVMNVVTTADAVYEGEELREDPLIPYLEAFSQCAPPPCPHVQRMARILTPQ